MLNLTVVHTKRMVPWKDLNSLEINQNEKGHLIINNMLISKCFFLKATYYFLKFLTRH